MMDRLDTRQLNRATLDRQLLFRRAARPALDTIGHLAGLQAQAPLAPYVGLWTRLAGFGHDDLKDLLMERIVVRAHLMRNTVHLVTAADFVRFRPLFQPRIERALAGHFGRNLGGVDLAELRAVAAVLLAETPADWTITRGRHRAVLEVRPFGPLGAARQDAVGAEGSRLLGFAAPADAHDVRLRTAS